MFDMHQPSTSLIYVYIHKDQIQIIWKEYEICIQVNMYIHMHICAYLYIYVLNVSIHKFK